MHTVEHDSMTPGVSRQFFGTDGIRGMANVEPLTPETVLRLGQATAAALLQGTRLSSSHQPPACVIGRDTRRSGPMLEDAMVAGLNSMGIDVFAAGIVPTPAVALLTRLRKAAAGVVVSASHNPFFDNGIKFFGHDGFKLADSEELAIEDLLLDTARFASRLRAPATGIGRVFPLEDALDCYVQSVLDAVDSHSRFLDGLKVALDAAHGAAFRSSPEILTTLGADLVFAFAEPDGDNINEQCGATHPEAIASLVRETRADVGVAHDGDADRVLLCDETGDCLDGDEILAIAATHLAPQGLLKQNSVAATIMSNFGLDDTLRALGGRVFRTGVGDRYVIEAMRQHDLNLGGEQSGHLIFADYSTTGDGIVAAVQILQIMAETGKPLSELRRCLTKFPQAQQNLAVRSKPPLEDLVEAQRLIAATESRLNGEGRVLLRYSGTEPKIRLLIEGRDRDQIESESARIADAIVRQIGA